MVLRVVVVVRKEAQYSLGDRSHGFFVLKIEGINVS